MHYKITALKEVTIMANFVYQRMQRVGGILVQVPAEKEEWFTLQAGEVKTGIIWISGVRPDYAPHISTTLVINGEEMVYVGDQAEDELPKEILGLFRLERDDTVPA